MKKINLKSVLAAGVVIAWLVTAVILIMQTSDNQYKTKEFSGIPSQYVQTRIKEVADDGEEYLLTPYDLTEHSYLIYTLNDNDERLFVIEKNQINAKELLAAVQSAEENKTEAQIQAVRSKNRYWCYNENGDWGYVARPVYIITAVGDTGNGTVEYAKANPGV